MAGKKNGSHVPWGLVWGTGFMGTGFTILIGPEIQGLYGEFRVATPETLGWTDWAI
mgnify:CR=1 FL=1